MWKDTPAPPLKVLLARLGEVVKETVFVENESFVIQKPSRSDKLVDPKDPAFADYTPYWADLWPAARMLAKVILREPWTAGAPALELGCGLGLPGIVALSRGLNVTFSDYDPCALHFASLNARFNGFDKVPTLQLDWRQPPADLRVPIVLGSDLIYEVSNVEPLVSVIKTVLLPGGLCLLTDQERIPTQVLRDALQAAGLPFATQLVRAGEPGGRRLKGTLYRIQQSA